MTVFPYRMRERDEVLGDLHHIENAEGGCLALIGKIPVLLPTELTERLQGLIGRRVGVLRLEGYRVRDLGTEHIVERGDIDRRCLRTCFAENPSTA